MFCITIAENTIEQVIKKLKKAEKYSDFFEIRIDYLEKVEKEFLIKLCQNSRKFIFTFRAPQEGGKKEIADVEKLSLILWLLDHCSALIDVEFFFFKKYYQIFLEKKEKFNNLLISYHNFEETPSDRKLKGILKKMQELCVKNAKVVTFCRKKEDWLRLLMLVAYARELGISLVAFGMGEEGKLSRILCLFFGSPFTYVVLDKKEAVAPGQFDIKTAKKIYQILKEF